MNLLLQDPFSILKEYPEKLTHTISNPLRSTCVEFSKRGDYLATGCLNGTIIIYDMDTFRPITVLGGNQSGHVRAVQSVEWDPRSDQFLLSCSRDMCVKIWNLQQLGSPIDNMGACGEIWFDSSVWGCQWVGSDANCCVVSVFEEPSAFLIDFDYDKDGSISNIEKISLLFDSDGMTDQGYVLVSEVHPKLSNIIITGSSKGWINFFKINDKNSEQPRYELIYSSRLANSNIKHIIVSENGDRLAINASDRTIRQFSLSISEIEDSGEAISFEIELEHKYQDVINKLQWNSIFFSNNSADYLIASPHGSSTHELYLWETSSGSLVRVLEGAEEELMDIDWNFYSMCIASNGLETGDIYIWSIVVPPKWSALAPDFEEIEENIDYQEKEDEFDLTTDEQEQQHRITKAEGVPIDLTARERFDVRGNNLTTHQFVIPTDYQRIVMMKQSNEDQINRHL